MAGRLIQCYGGTQGAGIGQLNIPRNLAVDRSDNMLVADYGNNRIVFLSPSLTHVGYISVSGDQMSDS